MYSLVVEIFDPETFRVPFGFCFPKLAGSKANCLPELGKSNVSGVTDRGLKPRQINKDAILGGGLTGSGIATTLLLSRYQVVLKEVNEKFLEGGLGRVKEL
ncbi:hypothetical protein L6452_43033 [Arctium lappa]|uniref:Uncharacterized protein n=1 Tax=Arctium lappa TaxID=4217 RepID=A0ACB8XK57_ARCLA|nr:hypothetical protein L6452_43033 [Arctium lappa]